MRRPRDPRRSKKQRPAAALAAAALIVVVSVPYVALHLPQQRTHRTEATPIIPDEAHDQPFAIYDAFAAVMPSEANKSFLGSQKYSMPSLPVLITPCSINSSLKNMTAPRHDDVPQDLPRPTS